MKAVSVIVVLIALCGCVGCYEDKFPPITVPLPEKIEKPAKVDPNEDRFVTFGPGKITKLTEGQFAYQEDDGRIFESQSSLFYDAGLMGKHCKSLRIFLSDGEWAQQIQGEGCK